jgi:uncharacterized RDD family membrane protein YckC
MAYPVQMQRDPTAVMGRRVVAYIIDVLIVLSIVVIVLAVTKDQSFTGAPDNACELLRTGDFDGQCIQIGTRVYTWEGGAAAISYGLGVLVALLNNVILQGITGASLGKFVMGLRVVNGEGRVCGVGRAFVRWLLLIVDSFCLGLVGLITASVTHPHRRVGDFVGGTYVIGVGDLGTPVVAPVTTDAWQPAYVGHPPGGFAQQPPPPSPWGAPAAPQQGTPPAWGTPPPQQQPAPTWGAPPPPPGPSPWEEPRPAPLPPSPAPPDPSSSGEAWWGRAPDESASDEEETQ